MPEKFSITIPEGVPEEVKKKMEEFVRLQESGRREVERGASLQGQRKRDERTRALFEQWGRGSAVIKKRGEEE